MIRLIGRRLIIPRGDTGSFTIPTQGAVEEGAIAILGIFDPLTNMIHQLPAVEVTGETLTFEFRTEDTKDLEPSDRYQWDIRICRGPIVDNETHEITGYTTIDSYYAAFGKSMPKCVIKQVAADV